MPRRGRTAVAGSKHRVDNDGFADYIAIRTEPHRMRPGRLEETQIRVGGRGGLASVVHLFHG